MPKKEIFDNIIGYPNIKESLKRLLDVLNNPEKYENLTSSISHGLFLYGPPGIGKTSFSKEFINNTKRKSYIIRKTKADGDFINYMSKIFKEAKANQPSLILLDDLDKFAESDNTNNSEEFVAVQSFIDDIKEYDIFIIATANEKNLIPTSLLRSGRFDYIIKMDNPNNTDSFAIIKYYLNNKKLNKDVNINNLSLILTGSSCADLEKVCNQAGIYAGFANEKDINMNELIKASLEIIYKANIEDLQKEDEYTIRIAYHEAGHALISELLKPGSVSFITVAKSNDNINGLTIYKKDDNYAKDITLMQNRVKTFLGGKAATEVIYHLCDTGSKSDLTNAFTTARIFVDEYCLFDFNSCITGYDENSQKVKENKDDNANKLITTYYSEVKELLLKNRTTLDNLAYQLKEKKILFQDDIATIINNTNRVD